MKSRKVSPKNFSKSGDSYELHGVEFPSRLKSYDQHIDEIGEWLRTERDLYTQFMDTKEDTPLLILRMRVTFLAFRDVPWLLQAARSVVLLDCGHSVDCLKEYTRTGKSICLKCEYEKGRKKKK